MRLAIGSNPDTLWYVLLIMRFDPSASAPRVIEILEVELLRAGVAQTGPNAHSMLGLDDPFLNWVKTSEGFGVPAVAVDSAEALAQHLERALMHRAPLN
jgi:hypothetical protein